jgi:AraC-like DNA-binding protein
LLFVGPSRQPFRRPVVSGERFIGVRFKPGAAAALGVVANEWGDRVGVLETVVGLAARRWEKKLSGISSIVRGHGQLELLLQTLLSCSHVDQAMVEAAAAIRAEKGRMTVADSAATAFLSIRQFQRRFQKAVGLNPKEFSRIVRLQAIARERFLDPALLWVNVSAQGGFFDQAHMIHEFTRLSGAAPSEFRRHLQSVRVEELCPWGPRPANE